MLPVRRVANYEQNQALVRAVATRELIVALEELAEVPIRDKLHLLRIMLGLAWMAAAASNVMQSSVRTRVLEQLRQLGFSCREAHDASTDDTWIEVAANDAVLHFVDVRDKNLSPLEAGLLHGLPASVGLVMEGILDEKPRPYGREPAVFEYFLSGRLSDQFEAEERRELESQWELMARASPRITSDAEREFAHFLQSSAR